MSGEEIEQVQAIKIFYSYAHEDQELRDELEKHLAALRRSGQITTWHDRKILPGAKWANEIDTGLDTADVILLLVSSSFIDSDYCWGKEMKRALERHLAGEARIVPVILRPVDWGNTVISELQLLPSGGKAVTAWADRNEAFENVARGIREVVRVLSYQKRKKGEIQQIAEGIIPIMNASLSRSQLFQGNILLVTNYELESKAVITIFEQMLDRKYERHFIGEKMYYFLGDVGEAKIFLVQLGMDTDERSMVLLRAVQELSTSAVILVGLASGFNEYIQNLGDIIVSAKIISYKIRRVTTRSSGESHFLFHSNHFSASKYLLDKFRDGYLDWNNPAKVHIGSIVSGTVVIDNKYFRNQLHNIDLTAIGDEIEDENLYVSLTENKVNWVTVRGICDWADGSKHVDIDIIRKQAVENVIDLILHLLQ